MYSDIYYFIVLCVIELLAQLNNVENHVCCAGEWQETGVKRCTPKKISSKQSASGTFWETLNKCVHGDKPRIAVIVA